MELCSPLGPDLIENLKRRDELPEWNDPVPMIRRRLGRGVPLGAVSRGVSMSLL
jgi:hypothetical protein